MSSQISTNRWREEYSSATKLNVLSNRVFFSPGFKSILICVCICSMVRIHWLMAHLLWVEMERVYFIRLILAVCGQWKPVYAVRSSFISVPPCVLCSLSLSHYTHTYFVVCPRTVLGFFCVIFHCRQQRTNEQIKIQKPIPTRSDNICKRITTTTERYIL